MTLQEDKYNKECRRLNGENWDKYMEEMKVVLEECEKIDAVITEKYMNDNLKLRLDGESLEERKERKAVTQMFKEKMAEYREKYNIVFPDR